MHVKKSTGIWKRAIVFIGKDNNIGVVYNDKHIIAKIKWYEGKTRTDFYENGLPPENFSTQHNRWYLLI